MALFSFLMGAVAFAVGSFLVKKVVGGSKRQDSRTNQKNRTSKNISTVKPQKTFSDIKETNNELEELRLKEQRDRFLNEKAKERIAELEQKVDSLYHEYETYKHQNALQLAQKNPQAYENFLITPENLHILQYHVGETVIGKRCSFCDRPMLLQFKRDKMVIEIDDLFWACSGWYFQECNVTQSFSMSDMALFAKDDKEEFNVTNQQFATILGNKNIQDHTTTRMRRHQGDSIDDYVCPIHKEPLILRQKREGSGILDDFFLGCPRWHPQGGCRYVLKLKSPAQLASFLYKTEERGIL